MAKVKLRPAYENIYTVVYANAINTVDMLTFRNVYMCMLKVTLGCVRCGSYPNLLRQSYSVLSFIANMWKTCLNS